MSGYEYPQRVTTLDGCVRELHRLRQGQHRAKVAGDKQAAEYLSRRIGRLRQVMSELPAENRYDTSVSANSGGPTGRTMDL